MPASGLSPLGTLLSELREERLRHCAPGPRPTRKTGPAEDVVLRIETGVVSAPPTSGLAGRAWLWPVSLLLHGVLLLCATLLPLVLDKSLPLPAGLAKAIFIEPALAPPPPPPPPPPRASAAPLPRPPAKAAPSETTFTAPVTIPERVAPEEMLDLGTATGEPGGVEGGVPGGVVGAVVGGLPPPPEQEVPVVKVGGEIREPKKLRHVNPAYPELAARARVQGTVVLECVVSPQGQVLKVSVLRSIPLLDAAAIEAVRQWAYTPTLKDGVPVKVLLTVNVRFALDTVR